MQAAALRLLRFFGVSLGLATAVGWAVGGTGVDAQSGPLRFEVSVPASAGSQPLDGRVLLMLSTDPSGEPRFQISDGVKTQQVFGVDVEGLPPGKAAVFDAAVLGYPAASLDQVPPGTYTVQALLHRYETFRRADGHTVKLPMDRGEGQQWNRAPGNLFSTPQKVAVDAKRGGTVRLALDQVIPAIPDPPDTKFVKHVRIQSDLLTKFWGRPMYLGAVLVLPDSVAKVSLVRLDAVPPRADDLAQLIRWHVRKSAPFPIEEAQVTYSPGAALPNGGREYVVALARAQVVREFERICSEAGVHAGLVDLATLSLVNTVLVANGPVSGDWLLVHITPDYGSIAILRGQDLIFFRNRAEGSDESLPDLVHQTAMYYEDRLSGGGFARVVVAGVGSDASPSASGAPTLDGIRRQIEARLGVATETVDPQRVARFSGRIAADPALTITIAPLVGALAGAGADV